MAKSTSDATAPRPLSGYKYFDQLDGLPTPLRPAGTQRDKAGNRNLFLDQYTQLLLLYFFNPIVTSLRAGRQYHTCEPESRLVARTLEQEWDELQREMTRLEAEFDRFMRTQPRRWGR